MHGQFKAIVLMIPVATVLVAKPLIGADVLRTPETDQALRYSFSRADESLLDEIQESCFDYLWKEVGEGANLVRDRLTTEVSSTAGVGFQLASLPIGAEREWVTRQQAEERAVAILRGLVGRHDNRKFGIYLHYVDPTTGGLHAASPTVQASTVDHALLQSGAVAAAMYFGGEVRELADQMIREANWKTFAGGSGEAVDEGGFKSGKRGQLSFGWRAPTGTSLEAPGSLRPWRWHVSSAEEQLVYFQAVGTPVAEHAVEPQVYYSLERKLGSHVDLQPYVVSWNGAMFTYFFAHCWIDFARFEADNPAEFDSEHPRVDWFENSRRAFLTHRQRCIQKGNEFDSLAVNTWGLSPCMGRNEEGRMSYLVQDLLPNHSGLDRWRGGTVAPYVAGSAMPFMPQESVAALRKMKSLKNEVGEPLVWWASPEGYGLRDSFNLDQMFAPDEYIAIDVGPMLLQIENARTGLIWRLFHEHPASKRAVERLRWKLAK